MSLNLDDMADEVYWRNLVSGWYSQERVFGEDIALIHSEVSEALEAYREHGLDDATAEQEYPDIPQKPEGVGSEFADILIRLLDACNRYDIDLEWEYRRKMDFNATRPKRHGGKRL